MRIALQISITLIALIVFFVGFSAIFFGQRDNFDGFDLESSEGDPSIPTGTEAVFEHEPDRENSRIILVKQDKANKGTEREVLKRLQDGHFI